MRIVTAFGGVLRPNSHCHLRTAWQAAQLAAFSFQRMCGLLPRDKNRVEVLFFARIGWISALLAAGFTWLQIKNINIASAWRSSRCASFSRSFGSSALAIHGGSCHGCKRNVSYLPIEPPVAVVEEVVDKKGTRDLAEFLYASEAQETMAQLHYRPRDIEALEKYRTELPPIPFFTIDETFGWLNAHQAFFADGVLFDQIYRPGK